MSRALDYLLTGGPARQKLADIAHGAIWARRLNQGHYNSVDIIPETPLFNQFDLSNRVALDIGAHAGSWAQVLARRVGPSGYVIAYEALPHYGRALSIALRIAGIRNIRVRNVAVGSSKGNVALRWRSERGDFLGGRTHIERVMQKDTGVVQVQMVSIDEDLISIGIKPEDVGFVKIDVEGAEVEVLQGASHLLRYGRPPVYLEAEPHSNANMGHAVRDVFSLMSDYGYMPFLVASDGIQATDLDRYLSQYERNRAGGAPSAFYNNVLFLPTVSQL